MPLNVQEARNANGALALARDDVRLHPGWGLPVVDVVADVTQPL